MVPSSENSECPSIKRFPVTIVANGGHVTESNLMIKAGECIASIN